MFGITNIFAFTIATIAIVLSPGQNTLFVLSLSIKAGIRYGIFGIAGVMLGDAVLMFLAATGAASFLLIYPNIFSFLQVTGALYLGYMGIKMIYVALKNWNEVILVKNAASLLESVITEKKAFYQAFFVSLLNPKAIIFLLTFFLQFIDPHYPNQFVPFFAQAIIIQIISCIYLSALIFFGARLAIKIKAKAQVQSTIQIGIGIILCTISTFMIFKVLI